MIATNLKITFLASLVAGLVYAGASTAATPSLSHSHDAVVSAPYGRVFTVGNAHLVKDRDFHGSRVHVSSLWIDHPGQAHPLEVAVNYCVRGQNLQNTHLTRMTLHHEGKTVAQLDQMIAAESKEDILAGSRIDMAGGLDSEHSGRSCLAGTTRFDLSGVRAALASLPPHTLQVELHFSNGTSQHWQLGAGTVQAIRQLPNLQKTGV